MTAKKFRGAYKFSGVILKMNKKTRKFYYTAELFDLYSKHSLLYCALEKIQKLEGLTEDLKEVL